MKPVRYDDDQWHNVVLQRDLRVVSEIGEEVNFRFKKELKFKSEIGCNTLLIEYHFLTSIRAP
jgi:hypothetical protein